MCAKGVAAFEPCGGNTLPTGKLAAGDKPEARGKTLDRTLIRRGVGMKKI